MPNWGKVHRVARELVAVLVEELGPREAARILEGAAAQVRGAGGKPVVAAAQEDGQPQPRRKRAKVVDLKR